MDTGPIFYKLKIKMEMLLEHKNKMLPNAGSSNWSQRSYKTPGYSRLKPVPILLHIFNADLFYLWLI